MLSCKNAVMLRNCDEDSGRSSCSAGSFNVNPITDINQDVSIKHFNLSKANTVNTEADLKVSIKPRSCTSLLKSPNERDPFPSCRPRKNQRNAVCNIFDTPRMGGLSNAHSSFNIASSTQIDYPLKIKTNAVSLSTIRAEDKSDWYVNKDNKINGNCRRGKPVQRAASRLYRADGPLKGEAKGCVGPEFIVRTSQPSKHINATNSITLEKRTIKVVLLNGQNVEVLCNPNTLTAGKLFEAIVVSEKYEHNFMLGIAVLIGGDFIFLPDDYKIKKVAPDNWYAKNMKREKIEDILSFTVFLRIKFFLPTNIARNIQGGEWRHRVYLQLRRSTVEGQLTSTLPNLILLAGYALHIEFGEFSFRDHGSGDYFLLEHYLPESYITNDMADVKLRMKRAHESRRGLEKNKAIINYIILAQTFRDYGAHFYSCVWVTRDGFCKDVWLSIGPKGVTLYSHNNTVTANDMKDNSPNRIVLQSLPWHHIHTFYYNKKSLYIVPNGHSSLSKIGIKYKLKMSDNKSYFAFWLASLHHRLYLKLYAKEDFINYLSDELSCPLGDNDPEKANCSNYQDSYNLAVRNRLPFRKQPKRKFNIDPIGKRVEFQNKENKKPSTEELLRQILSQSYDKINSSNDVYYHPNSSKDYLSSPESCSQLKRHGVKMGTRVFNGSKSEFNDKYLRSVSSSQMEGDVKCAADFAASQYDSDDLCSEKTLHDCTINSMKLLPERQYSKDSATAFVIESPKVYQDAFTYNLTSNESCLNKSLYERLENMSCVQGERVFVTANIKRDHMNALGIQVAEGSDGNVYIQSITNGGPADLSKKLLPGDQIISLNGQTLLNMKYNVALAMLQSAPHNVELIVLQTLNNTSLHNTDNRPISEVITHLDEESRMIRNSIASTLDDAEITDSELLNEEALKTIHALIKLSKEKVINRFKEKGSLNTPNKNFLQKCLSANMVYDESDFSSQESVLQKRNNKKFNTWRDQTHYRAKRRPLSLSIPSNVNLPNDYLNEDVIEKHLLNKASLNSIKSSLNSLDANVASVSRNVALPRNFGQSRKWVGPVRYPVTPCKNDNVQNGAMLEADIVRKHFVYGAGTTDDQIYL